VFQNFEGDFKDHPDSDFPSVIRSSQAVLFTIMPWRSPMCVERVWCLYEALQAVLENVDLDLLVEEVQSSQSVLKLKQMFYKVVVDNLDLRNCQATVAADKDYIISQIESSLGMERFNLIMRQALHSKVTKRLDSSSPCFYPLRKITVILVILVITVILIIAIRDLSSDYFPSTSLSLLSQ
jgi:hypothetical protein